jgi:heavy metal sensor kinase
MAILRSVRVRLTLWYVLLLALTLAVFSGGVYLALRQNLYSNLNNSLDSRANIVSDIVVQGGELDVSPLDAEPESDEEFVRVYGDSGALIFDNAVSDVQPGDDPDAVSAALVGDSSRRSISTGDEHLKVLVAPMRSDGEVIGVIEIGLTEDDVRETLSTLLIIIALAYPIVLIVTSAGGVFLAGRALSPIDRVTRVARRISAEDLSQRLDLDLPDDEVGRLAVTFDEMIARLDEAFRRQRQFTSDASHELRTPLTAIKGQTEVALQRDRDAEEYRDVLRTVNAEVDRMIRLVSSLLTLARADASNIPINRERFGVERIITDAVESIRPAAREKNVSLSVASAEDVDLLADQDLVLQLLLNLLDNAVKYSDPGGSVTVSWRAMPGHVEIDVADTGPGITAEHLAHVFDRFYRIDPARSRAAGGAGLGLSICRWIAEAHGGSISAASAPGEGATFTVRLPSA